jgi:hypothetical protein
VSESISSPTLPMNGASFGPAADNAVSKCPVQSSFLPVRFEGLNTSVRIRDEPLAAVVAAVILHEVDRRAWGGLFEVDNPTYFARLEPLWRLLACTVPGVAVGYLVARRSTLIGAIVYGISAWVSFAYHGGSGSIALGNVLPERQFILPILREWLVFVAIGFATAAYGASLHRRFQLQRNRRNRKAISGR